MRIIQNRESSEQCLAHSRWSEKHKLAGQSLVARKQVEKHMAACGDKCLRRNRTHAYLECLFCPLFPSFLVPFLSPFYFLFLFHFLLFSFLLSCFPFPLFFLRSFSHKRIESLRLKLLSKWQLSISYFKTSLRPWCIKDKSHLTFYNLEQSLQLLPSALSLLWKGWKHHQPYAASAFREKTNKATMSNRS